LRLESDTRGSEAYATQQSNKRPKIRKLPGSDSRPRLVATWEVRKSHS
jgi:hypothetical protein